MLCYLIITYLLSLIGLALYWWVFRGRMGPKNRKVVLLGVIVLSLIIPFGFVDAPTQLDDLEHTAHYKVSADIFADFCPKEDVLDACYTLAQSQTEFCQCEQVEKENIIIYESNWLYDCLNFQESAFWKLLYLGGGLLSLLLIAQVLYLNFIVRSSKKENFVFDGEEYVLLHPRRQLSVGSFQLGKKYIIWQRELDELSDEERNAVLWHEIAHIRQKDTWVKIVVNVLHIFWLINPVFYILKKELDQLNEYLADQLAVLKTGNAKAYAHLLLKMKSYQHTALAYHFKQNAIKHRIDHILKGFSKERWSMAIVSTFVIALIFGGVTYFSLPGINHQIATLEVYKTLASESSERGRHYFCKQCLIDQME